MGIMREMDGAEALASLTIFALAAVVGGFLFHIGWNALDFLTSVKW